MTRKRAGWLALALVVVVALFVATNDRDARTDAERVDDIAASVACPACEGQSVRDSDAIASRNIKQDIERRVKAGESDGEIRDAIAAAFGKEVLLNPPAEGAASLVWVLPVVVLVVAVAGVAVAFRRWQRV